ncbi:MAG TPA: hypothetical protein VFF95_03020 [Candidatus Binatus sp.]|jgi:hypothetical protein|nr:hypothetical protein [Candidatus Binatus sp.]
MALITGLGLIAVSILTAALSRILAEEMGAWNPSIIRGLIKLAVGRLPEGRRERFQEEWQSHVNEVPGQIGKLLVAVGFLLAAYKLAWSDWRNRARERRVSFLVVVDEALSNATRLVNLTLSHKDLVPLERAEQARLLLSELQESRNHLYAVTPDTRLTWILNLLHPVKAHRLAGTVEQIEHQTKRIKQLNSRIRNLLGELERK